MFTILNFSYIILSLLKFKQKENIFLLLSVLVSCILLIEMGLRFFSTEYTTYFEKAHEIYRSYYDIYKVNQLSYPPNDTITFEAKNEYKYAFTTNSQGYCDQEWSPEKQGNEYRILTLGDSFTVGMGAPMESSWVNVLKRKLKVEGKIVNALNAGVSGSDIVNEVYKAKKLSPLYHPDAIILCLNVSDIVDIYLRGGESRFSNPQTPTNPIGNWEKLYQYSFIYRVYIHNIKKRDFLFLSENEEKQLEEKSIKIISAELRNLNQYCIVNKITFFFFIHPHGMELKDAKYLYKNFPVVRGELEDISTDLMDNFIDLKSFVAYENIYHKNDRHFNTLGYKYMGDFIVDSFEEKIIQRVNVD
ncbi:MAG: hypothetical protein M9887_11520 [Chitinophagales bacterium]|nr:hypothetical protein [Chitinophagales bacterium]